MAKYKVLMKSFINDRPYDVGDTVEYDGVPADNLQPLDKDAKAAVAAAAAAGVPTAVPNDWSPPLSISDALAGTSGVVALGTASPADLPPPVPAPTA